MSGLKAGLWICRQPMSKEEKNAPWYAGEHQDALFYLLIAIFIVELAVGGVSFFYGIIHAAPETPGGPPMARFPWLAWAVSAIMAPVALLAIVHLAGSGLSRALGRESEPGGKGLNEEELPPGLRRFYAAVRHAPTIVLLLAILLAGAFLFFMDGALEALGRFGSALLPYLPWLAGCGAALLGFCFLIHALMVFRQRKMENEYAWRREVLEKTGLVLVDRKSSALPQTEAQKALLAPENQTIDIAALPGGENEKDEKS